MLTCLPAYLFMHSHVCAMKLLLLLCLLPSRFQCNGSITSQLLVVSVESCLQSCCVLTGMLTILACLFAELQVTPGSNGATMAI